jgi:1,4-dihydroxy-2-naphthoate octaprenyltransferase
MNNPSVSRDERSVVVENASYRIAYLVMSFGLLASVAYRGFVLQQSSWDLLALVILGGATATMYQGTNKVISRRGIIATVATIVIAGLIAVAFVILFR